MYSCNSKPNLEHASSEKGTYGTEKHILDPYWFDGNAEINTYELEQVRYGAIHKGKAVALFVTEPYIKSKQVKADQYDPKNPDHTLVLKLNHIKEFQTGVYPYRLFSSVFTELGEMSSAHALKVVSAIYEWCGAVFAQLNQHNSHNELKLYSYFESEGDMLNRIPIQSLEDEIMNLIRIQPDLLPIGDIQMLPAFDYCRFKHLPIQSVRANCAINQINDSVAEYRIHQEDIDRDFRIQYKNKSPFDILHWEETHLEDGVLMTSSATRIHKAKLQYWRLHQVSDTIYLKELGL